MFSVYICDSCRFSLLSFILSFLPLLFLSQSLVFVAIVFIIFIILLLVCQYSASCFIVFSASFVSGSWCYWVFFFVCNYAIIAAVCWSVPWTCLWSVFSVSVSLSEYILSLNCESARLFCHCREKGSMSVLSDLC